MGCEADPAGAAAAGPAWHAAEMPGGSRCRRSSTINRILPAGAGEGATAEAAAGSFMRFERPGPMQLWGIDIVGGIQLVNPVTGELREAKIVTGVDDHSRFCVMAAGGRAGHRRAVCLAFAQALARFGVPEEVITDNGKQFTDRFSRYGPTRGEVLFDKICRHNGITHRLTAPASPNQNGKVERFHGTFRPRSASWDRSSRSRRRRPRSMRGSRTTTPSGRTRPSTSRSRWCPPTGSPQRPRQARAVAADRARGRSIGIRIGAGYGWFGGD